MRKLICILFGHDFKQTRFGLRADGKALHKCTRCKATRMLIPKGEVKR